MKKVLTLAVAVILTLILISCTKSNGDTPKLTSIAVTEKEPTEQVFARDLIDDTVKEQILVTAKEAVTKKYPTLDGNFQYFKIYIDQHGVEKELFFVEFDFYLHGYRTSESYVVTLKQTDENTFTVKDVSASDEGVFMKFVDLVSRKQIKEAENKIIYKYGKKGAFSLQVDKEGALIIHAEYIIKKNSLKSILGLKKGHERVIFTEVIYRPEK